MANGYITTLKDVRPHPNADRLQLATVFTNQIIVPLTAKEGDLGVYFPTDTQLGVEFAEANDLVRRKDENGNDVGGYLDPAKRHIRSLKLRGEFSDGLFLPIESLAGFTDTSKLQIGDVINELKGIVICRKYIPNRNKKANSGNNQKKTRPANLFPQFQQHIDTKQLAYHLGDLAPGDIIHLTGKLHGTSGRTGHLPKVTTQPQNFFQKLFRIKPKVTTEYKYVTGTRRVTLDFDENKDTGYYGDNSFRKKYHDYLVDKLHKGETIYYEIVGYVDENTPIMPTVNNKKINDKDFVKQYGPATTFSYGCQAGQNEMYAYRMTLTSADGHVIEYPQDLIELRCEQMGIKTVPHLDTFMYTTQEDLMARVKFHEYGPDWLDPSHIREGIVVRVEDSAQFKAYKVKNIYFKILEGIVKEDALVADMEEQEEEYNE